MTKHASCGLDFDATFYRGDCQVYAGQVPGGHNADHAKHSSCGLTSTIEPTVLGAMPSFADWPIPGGSCRLGPGF